VARRWQAQGGGNGLGVVLEAAGVRVRRSASLALERGTVDSVAGGLADFLCAEITGADWTRLGSYASPGGVWIVLAVPSLPPAKSDAQAILAEALRETNAFRSRGAVCGTRRFGPAPPLTIDAKLIRAAQMQADEMARHQFLAHEGRDGSTPADRVVRAGYAWRLVGENVAAGPESAAEVMAGWEHSPEHCNNLMQPQFTQMGLAFAVNARSTGHSTWWSMVLARPKE
jgi:uncharacterized protein YkwD